MSFAIRSRRPHSWRGALNSDPSDAHLPPKKVKWAYLNISRQLSTGSNRRVTEDEATKREGESRRGDTQSNRGGGDSRVHGHIEFGDDSPHITTTQPTDRGVRPDDPKPSQGMEDMAGRGGPDDNAQGDMARSQTHNRSRDLPGNNGSSSGDTTEGEQEPGVTGTLDGPDSGTGSGGVESCERDKTDKEICCHGDGCASNSSSGGGGDNGSAGGSNSGTGDSDETDLAERLAGEASGLAAKIANEGFLSLSSEEKALYHKLNTPPRKFSNSDTNLMSNALNQKFIVYQVSCARSKPGQVQGLPGHSVVSCNRSNQRMITVVKHDEWVNKEDWILDMEARNYSQIKTNIKTFYRARHKRVAGYDEWNKGTEAQRMRARATGGNDAPGKTEWDASDDWTGHTTFNVDRLLADRVYDDLDEMLLGDGWHPSIPKGGAQKTEASANSNAERRDEDKENSGTSADSSDNVVPVLVESGAAAVKTEDTDEPVTTADTKLPTDEEEDCGVWCPDEEVPTQADKLKTAGYKKARPGTGGVIATGNVNVDGKVEYVQVGPDYFSWVRAGCGPSSVKCPGDWIASAPKIYI